MNRLGAFFPWPLVGVALLLVTLILLTPVLLSTGGSGCTQAELVVDRVTGSNTTNFYVHAFCTTVRFATISLATASDFNWTGSYPSSGLDWVDWQNQTNVLTSLLFSLDNPVAVYVSATYVGASSSTTYVGMIAFYVSSVGTPGETLNAAVAPATSGVTVAASTPVTQLPLAIPLEPYSGGSLV